VSYPIGKHKINENIYKIEKNEGTNRRISCKERERDASNTHHEEITLHT
jgi:hypothetical protein